MTDEALELQVPVGVQRDFHAPLPVEPRDRASASSLFIPDAWRSLLRGDLDTVVRRLGAGDPLLLLPRCAERLQDVLWFLLDIDRLHAHCTNRVAVTGGPDVDMTTDEWLAMCIDESARDLVREDEHEDLVERAPWTPDDARYAFLTKHLQLSARSARRIAVRFNGLPEGSRRAFFALVIKGWSLESCVAQGLGPREELVNDVRHAWQVIRSVHDRQERTQAARARGTEHPFVRAYREHVAILLRRACLLDCYEDPSTQDWLHRGVTDDRRLVLPSWSAWKRGVERALETCPDESDCCTAADLLKTCCAKWSERPSVARLALASLRCSPSNEARVYYAFDCVRSGERDRARSVLLKVVESSASELMTSIAWENLAFVLSRMTKYTEACDAYRQASSTRTTRSETMALWFLFSLGLARRDEALHVARKLDMLVTPGGSAVQWIVTTLRRYWNDESFELHHVARASLSQIESRLGPTSMRVAQALADE